jgi:ParB family chromosome partitioning protein
VTAPAGQDWSKDLARGVEPLDPAEVAPAPPEKKKGKRESAATPPAPEGEFAYLPLEQLFESPSNPRKHFDPAKLKELQDSIAASGIYTPLAVRPAPKGRYEIGAGHRRFRAAKALGLPLLPCRIRPMDDAAFLALLAVENPQHDPLHPLEEAEGYRRLMVEGRADVAAIAARVGRSVKYVYDRMKLLQLTKEAKQLFLDGQMTAGHAILLARLTPADQARALDSERSGNGRVGGLFVSDFGDSGLGLEDPDEAVKPVSVREFDRWIADNVRFSKAAPDPMLFPETATTIQAAVEQKEKIVAITHDYQVPPEARDEKERTYGPMSWKRADGQDAYDRQTGRKAKSKVCERSVTGVIVIGPGRGEAFRVCVDRKCAAHWPEKKATAGKKAPKDDWQERQRRQNEECAKRAEKEKAEGARWEKARPAILEALVVKIKAAPTGARSQLADIIVRAVSRSSVNAQLAIGRGTTAEDLVRHAAFLVLVQVLRDRWQGPREFPKLAKAFGVDVAKILDQAAPEEKVKKPGKAGECEICGCTEKKACEGGCAWDPKYRAKKRWVCTSCSKQADALVAKATKTSKAKKR